MMLYPGDPKALENGCTCPSEVNQEGQGTFNLVQDPRHKHFLIEEECPMHGKSTWRDDS